MISTLHHYLPLTIRAHIVCAIVFCCVESSLFAQTFQIPTDPVDQGDTALVFTSPRPWLEKVEAVKPTNSGLGLDILLSGPVFGLGTTYMKRLSDDLYATAGFGFIAKQTSDEIEYVDPFGNVVIPFKINRIMTLPLTLGVQFFPLGDEKVLFLGRPLLVGGVGTTLALIGPYSRDGFPPYFDFFQSMSRAKAILRPTIYIGGGFEFNSFGSSFIQASLRYYITPAGGDGILYFRDNTSPDGFKRHTDLGGVMLTLSIGSRY